MKKALTYTLAVAMLLSLAACGHKDTQQDTSQPDPAAISTQADVSTPEPPAEPEPEPPAIPAPEQLSSRTQAVTDKTDTSQPPEETDPQEPADEIQLFNDCNEVVYATGSVNIRASWNADSEKLGSLSVGQSVTRTGTSISGTEAEGWSRVQLSNGTTAYISNKYLSTTKPVVQQTQSSQTTQTVKPVQSSTQATQNTQTTKPAQSSTQEQTPASAPDDPYVGMTPEERGRAAREQAMAEWKAEGFEGPREAYTDEELAEIGRRLNGG